MKIPALYIRVSGEEQARGGNSIEGQHDALINFLKVNVEYTFDENLHGLKVKVVDGGKFFTTSPNGLLYIDDGVSGAKSIKERCALDKLFKDAKANKFDTVLVWKIDRFFRNTQKLLSAIEELKSLNIGFKSITQDFDTNTSYGKMALTMLASVAEMERDNTMERTAMGRNKSIADEKWLAGSCGPFGYSIVDKRLIINEKEAEVVRFIYDEFVTNQLTSAQLQTRINQAGLLTPLSMRGKKRNMVNSPTFWKKRTITRILSNPIYTGLHIYRKFKKVNGRMIENKNTAEHVRVRNENWRILSDETFNAAQAQLKRNKELSFRNTHKDKMLRGLIHCPECGRIMGAMYDKNKKRTRYYCYFRLRAHTSNLCKAKSIGDASIEPVVWGAVSDVLTNPQLMIRELNQHVENRLNIEALRAELAQLKKEYASNSKQQKNILQMCESGLYKIQYATLKVDKLRKEREELERRIDSLNNEITPITDIPQKVRMVNRLKRHLTVLFRQEKITYEDKCQIVRMLVEKIGIKGDGVDIYFKIGEPPKIQLRDRGRIHRDL